MGTSNAVTSPHADRILAVHAWQQSSNDCGPFSASFVINALTPTPVDPSRLARELDRPSWNGLLPVIRRVPNWASFPWGVADILRRNGVPAAWRPLFTPGGLIECLTKGEIPLVFIGHWRPPSGHVMVLLAWDAVQGWGFADPAIQESRLHWFDHGWLARSWATYGRVVVIARPSFS